MNGIHLRVPLERDQSARSGPCAKTTLGSRSRQGVGISPNFAFPKGLGKMPKPATRMVALRLSPVTSLFLVLVIVFAWLPETRAHEIVLKGGQIVEADEIRIEGDKLITVASIGGGTAQVPYPMSRVESIRFSLSEAQAALLESGDSSRLGDLKAFWLSRRPFLGVPGSDAGAMALHYARLLVAQQEEALAREALALAAEVAEGDWNESRQRDAMRLRVSALAAAGRIEEAMQEADAMESLGATDDTGLAEARVRSKFIQAELAWNQMKQLEKDWPKWHLMPEKRAERTELLNRALDLYLFPVVAHSELQSICAEGLVQAGRIYLHLDRVEHAQRCALEVINYFPDPAFVGQAREIQRKTNQTQQGNSS